MGILLMSCASRCRSFELIEELEGGLFGVCAEKDSDPNTGWPSWTVQLGILR